MKKRVGILTINDYNNYGNRLQNYATQEVLKSLGFTVETTINNNFEVYHKNVQEKNKVSKIKKFSTNADKQILIKIKNKILKSLTKKYRVKRSIAFKTFTSSFIKETDFAISDSNIPENLSSEYDFFVTGSDQVWNFNLRMGSPIDFLAFADKNKRIAYAPSFGVSEIPLEYQDKYKQWLLEMQSLSVRENAGAKIIEKLTGRDSTVVVDPTLMLDKEQWLAISKEPTKIPQKYLLTYFLGNVSTEKRKLLYEIAEKNNLIIINLSNINDRSAYVAGPDEFLYYINSASLFCTDSFHGAVFSILFEKPFIVFDRGSKVSSNSMNSRIDTLISTFKLESRLAKNVDMNGDVFNIDFTHVQQILKSERNKAINYLKGAFGIK